MKKSISVADLRFGMYVAELDRPWTETPLMFQGVVLKTEQQLETLKKFCTKVTVDAERGEPVAGPSAPEPGVRHKTQVSVEREVEKAKLAHTGAQHTIRAVVEAVRANKAIDVKSVEQAVSSMTESVLRNPDALLLFS